MKWIVQNNLRFGDKDVIKIKEACKKYGHEFIGVKVLPFSDDVPIAKDNEIYYGGTGWINKIYNKNPSANGIFFNPESIFTYWVDKYKDKALNYMAFETTLNKLSSISYKDDKLFFIRPVSDLKDFNGSVMRFKDIKNWKKMININCPNFGDLPIVVNEPYGIANEWRLFIINKKVITGSHYRSYGVLHVYPNLPDRIIKFAEEQANIYSPNDVFVMDICESDKNIYIIEIGCFNSAGFYDSNIDKIVREVSLVLQ
jgi:hypothetical protein